MRRSLLTVVLSLFWGSLVADTMEHYMNIANQIPKMRMKADSQSQAWARSAQSVLVITNESIAETLMQVNELASKEGKPLFCLPPAKVLSAAILDEMIVDVYNKMPGQQSDKDKMTVSQVAWIAITKAYPCQGVASSNANTNANPNPFAAQIQARAQAQEQPKIPQAVLGQNPISDPALVQMQHMASAMAPH